MKFNRVLHPEIIYNLRGDENQRSAYNELLSNTSYEPGRGYLTVTALVSRDPILSNHISICHRFMLEKGNCYYANRDFCEELQKIDREIPIEYLPDRWVGYFSFAPGAVKDESVTIDGAYVFIGPAAETTLTPDSPNFKEKILWISYVCSNGFIGHLLAPILPDRLTSIINPLPCIDVYHAGGNTTRNYTRMEDRADRNHVYLLCLNLILYLFSQGREVMSLTPYNKLKPSEKKNATHKNYANLPLHYIAPNHEARYFSVDKTWVRTHPRWQRCGKGLSEIRLVWVQGHERNYRNEAAEASRTAAPVGQPAP